MASSSSSSSTSSSSRKTGVVSASGPSKDVIPVKIKYSASLVLNNLVACSSHLAYIHKNQVLVTSVSSLHETLQAENRGTITHACSKTPSADKSAVAQLAYVKLGSTQYLAIVTEEGGLQMWDERGESCRHTLNCSLTSSALKEHQIEQRFSGLASDGQKLLVGINSGTLLLIGIVGHGSQDSHAISHHAAPVTAIAANNDVIISGDSSGHVAVWRAPLHKGDIPVFAYDAPPARRNPAGLPDSTKLPADETDGSEAGVSCTAVDIGGDLLVAAYSTGHLRVFSVTRKHLLCEIAAHSRRINAIKCHASAPLVAAVGEDGFVTVWTLPTARTGHRVTPLLCHSPEPSLLTGVQWLPPTEQPESKAAGDADCDRLVVTAYDSNACWVLNVPKIG